MKVFFAVILGLFLSQSQASPKEEVSGGRILCSMTSPKTVGFELVKVGAKDRVYQGEFEMGDLKFEGAYTSKTADLELKVSKMDADWVVVEEMLSMETKLYSGNFLRLKTKAVDRQLEMFCYFVAQ
jgi:hypothetical protein